MFTEQVRIKNAGILAIFFLLVFNGGWNLCLAQEEKAHPYEEMREPFKTSNNEYYIKARKLFLNEKYTKAEKLLEKCIEIYPQHANAHYLLAQIDYKRGEFSEALESIEKAKSHFEDFINMHIWFKKQNLKNLAESMDQLQSELEFKQLEGRIENIRNALADTSVQIKEAREDYTNFVASTEKMRADYYYIHGNIFFKMKDYTKAVAQYSEAIKINPKHGNAYNNLAIIYFSAKQYQKALDFLNQAESHGVKVNPKLKEDILNHIKEQ